MGIEDGRLMLLSSLYYVAMICRALLFLSFCSIFLLLLLVVRMQ